MPGAAQVPGEGHGKVAIGDYTRYLAVLVEHDESAGARLQHAAACGHEIGLLRGHLCGGAVMMSADFMGPPCQ